MYRWQSSQVRSGPARSSAKMRAPEPLWPQITEKIGRRNTRSGDTAAGSGVSTYLRLQLPVALQTAAAVVQQLREGPR